MISRALTTFIHDLIRDNQSLTGHNCLFVSDLSLEDKKIFMSHIDIFEYEHFINNPVGMLALLDEYKNYMQQLIDEEVNDYSIECMRDIGLHSNISPINGETFWNKAS